MGGWRDDFEPRVETARVLLKQSLLADLARAQQECARLLGAGIVEGSLADSPTTAELEAADAKLQAAFQAVEDARHEFRFVQVPKSAWYALIAEHPPSDEQRAEGFGHDPVGVRAPMLALCSLEPKLAADDAEFLLDSLLPEDLGACLDACYLANVGGLPKALSVRELLQWSEKSQAPQPPSAGPDLVSLAGE